MNVDEKPVRAKKGPFVVDVVEGRAYLWCSCGRSTSQPFCDNSHKGTGFEPVRFLASENRSIFFCGCKESKVAPLCDGSHSFLKGYGGTSKEGTS